MRHTTTSMARRVIIMNYAPSYLNYLSIWAHSYEKKVFVLKQDIQRARRLHHPITWATYTYALKILQGTIEIKE